MRSSHLALNSVLMYSVFEFDILRESYLNDGINLLS